MGGGGGVGGGAGAAAVLLLDRGRVGDGALVAVVVCTKTEARCHLKAPGNRRAPPPRHTHTQPTVHVHHPRGRAVLGGGQLGAVLLVFALLLVLVLLQRLRGEKGVISTSPDTKTNWGGETHVVRLGLRHWDPLVDAEGRVSHGHPLLLPVVQPNMSRDPTNNTPAAQ